MRVDRTLKLTCKCAPLHVSDAANYDRLPPVMCMITLRHRTQLAPQQSVWWLYNQSLLGLQTQGNNQSEYNLWISYSTDTLQAADQQHVLTCAACSDRPGGSGAGAMKRVTSVPTPSGSTAMALMTRLRHWGKQLMPATHLRSVQQRKTGQR